MLSSIYQSAIFLNWQSEKKSLCYDSIVHSDHQKVCAECCRQKQSLHWDKYGECLIHERRRKGIRKIIWHFTGMQIPLDSSARALFWNTICSKSPAYSLFTDVFAPPIWSSYSLSSSRVNTHLWRIQISLTAFKCLSYKITLECSEALSGTTIFLVLKGQ